MKVAIAGGTGFIGGHLTRYYTQRGTEVILISRSSRESDDRLVSYVTWSELEQDASMLEGADAIINLAGESINQRWTAAAKARILQSRLDSVQRVGRIVQRLERKPVLVNASGMSVYGLSETESFTEESPHRLDHFLAEVVEKWEAEVGRVPAARTVMLRVGVVLGNDGGAYPKMRLPFLFGAGGRIGSGRQWLSWIHVDDMVRLIDYCVSNRQMQGPVNATAPEPVRSDSFGRSLAKAMGRPYLFPVPAFVMKLVFGEMSMLLLEGQRVLPQAALKDGFQFTYPAIDEALRHLVQTAKGG
ncbi:MULTISPECIES: TIGR01777 family oxidoreductase [Paenibacillus]|uniref:TIGR01777 family oxidoreductase n=1 Tax=Paenibacillus TaxID=44249 RepID=UPI0022B925B0|nr:TIGR01777 family oxidoreductase [Paenibacillus caseinilyticus]MCZ8521546.1 TIGR01777 family oxidoreductase [Paenibacillus caseinilyticus]